MHTVWNTSQRQFRWATALIVVLAGAAAYVNTLDGEWVWDDFSSVLLHRHVQQPDKFFQLFLEDQHAFGRGQGNFYRPLVAASFMLDFLIAGGTPLPTDDDRSIPDVSPTVFHVTNAAWHIAAALLLFSLLIRMRAPQLAQWSVPLIFVLHPLHTEAVAYISGRADMMSACFIFSALYCALSSRQGIKKLLMDIASLLLFVLGLLSKESSLIYPVLLAILVFWLPPSPADTEASSKRSGIRIRLFPLIGSILILLVYVALRASVLNFGDGAAALTATAPFHQRIAQSLQAIAIYARLLFVPTGLHMERTLDHATVLHTLGGCLFLALISLGMGWGQIKKLPVVTIGLAWFVAAWLPISGLFPLNAPLAEHWMYVPMAGFWWALLTVVDHVCRRPRPRTALYAAIAGCSLFFLTATVQQNREWHNQETLFRSVLARNPDSTRVHYNLAVAYDYMLNNWAGARRHYEQFLRIRERRRQETGTSGQAIPTDELEAILSLGRILFLMQDYAGAAGLLSPMAALPKEAPYLSIAAEATWLTGKSLLALGDIVAAHSAMEQAIVLQPERTPEIESFIAGAPFADRF